MSRLIVAAAAALAVLGTAPVLAQPSPAPRLPASVATSQDPFEIPSASSTRFNLGGHVELRPVAVWLDRESLSSRLRAPGSNERWLSQMNGQLLVDAGLRRGLFSVSTRSVLDGSRAAGEWSGSTSSYEAFVSLKPSASLAIDAGKRTMKWGKGYAWNPAAFLDRPKNPEDPSLALEGVVVVSADLIRSFAGPLQTVALTPVVVPVYEGVNESIGRTGHLHAAGKLYLLLYDTDLDVMFMTGGSRPARWALDFSRNLRSDVELHGEFAMSADELTRLVGPDGQIAEQRRKGASWLLGTRYLAPSNTTFIVEYYRRGTGFTRDEIGWYYDAVEKALSEFAVNADPRALQAAGSLGQYGYADRQPMRNYLFARASQPDAFGRLYLNAAVTTIVNLVDGSFSLMQEMQYRLLGNLEIRSQAGAIIGSRETDFGERQGNLRLELRARYSF